MNHLVVHVLRIRRAAPIGAALLARYRAPPVAPAREGRSIPCTSRETGKFALPKQPMRACVCYAARATVRCCWQAGAAHASIAVAERYNPPRHGLLPLLRASCTPASCNPPMAPRRPSMTHPTLLALLAKATRLSLHGRTRTGLVITSAACMVIVGLARLVASAEVTYHRCVSSRFSVASRYL